MRTTNGSGLPTVGAGEVHVLLVDDDETWATSTAQILEHQRDAFDVRTAFDLADASAAFEAGDTDCVVCDYQLEEGTGLDLLAEVRDRAPDLPFILVTGQGSEGLASDAIGRQVTDYVPKRSLGGSEDLLARRIETTVDTYRTRMALARERQSKEAMLDIVTETSSQGGLAREFCEHLVRERVYDCAWIGTFGPSGEVIPQAVAGDEAYPDQAIRTGRTPEEGSEPALVALARREPYHVAPIDSDLRGTEGWRSVATDRGFQSATAVPIEHQGTVFGVLSVYATTDATGAWERELLEEYGETIGYALRSAEWRKSLLSGGPVAVEVEIEDERAPLVALDRRLTTGSAVEVLTTIPGDRHLRYVTRVTGTSPEDVRDAAHAVDAIEEATIDRSDADLRCDFVVTMPTPETVLVEQGGQIAQSRVERGRASITTHATDEENFRPLVDAVESEYPDAGIRSVRTTDTSSDGSAVDDPLESLTTKQRRAVELAFYEGYYEHPREHNNTEIAEMLGVSRPTFTQHIRAGERKILSELLDSSSR
jgi:predicted DNA binding protein/DNA-binding NarL/FixJ family response regulator